MERIDHIIRTLATDSLRELWSLRIDPAEIQIQKTRKEFRGDYTLVVFPFLKASKSPPDETGSSMGAFMKKHSPLIKDYNVIKGFLNVSVSPEYWKDYLRADLGDPDYGTKKRGTGSMKVMIEFSSPNTNKPLHLGHIRNILLGHSVARILEAGGHEVRQVNLVNDRGIHICKSMLAWKTHAGGVTPESTGQKGDHFVGDYYVRFEQDYREQVASLMEKGHSREEAEAKAPVLEQAREMLRNWEAGDREVRSLWEKMNGWVYEGFDKTYHRLGVSFDKTYYESETYMMGRELILKGLRDGILYRKADGSVWVDLEDEGLDHKLLLRADGTSVYMTQDVGTAHQRHSEFPFDSHIYVVGNEQNYHFQVLSLVLKKLGYDWADKLYHLSYGMVELPEGKMKSREGTVVDADDLMDEMEETARKMSEELGKLEGYGPDERNRIFSQVGMGALKYFILKVDPRKNMTFDPGESVDFNGNTGPFIQYTHARIRSVLRKAESLGNGHAGEMDDLNQKEVELVKMLFEYPDIVEEAGQTLNPSLIANHLYEVSKEFNQFYHDHSILNPESPGQVATRLLLVQVIGSLIQKGMELLGIEVPERM